MSFHQILMNTQAHVRSRRLPLSRSLPPWTVFSAFVCPPSPILFEAIVVGLNAASIHGRLCLFSAAVPTLSMCAAHQLLGKFIVDAKRERSRTQTFRHLCAGQRKSAACECVCVCVYHDEMHSHVIIMKGKQCNP